MPQPNLSHSYESAIHHDLNKAAFAVMTRRNSGHVDIDASFRRFASFAETAEHRQSWYGKNAFGGNQAVLPWCTSDTFDGRAACRTGCAKNSDLFFALPPLIGSTLCSPRHAGTAWPDSARYASAARTIGRSGQTFSRGRRRPPLRRKPGQPSPCLARHAGPGPRM